MARRKAEKAVNLAPEVDPYLLEAEMARRQEGGNFVFYHPGVEKNCIAIGGGVFDECGIPDGYEYNVAAWSGYGACPIRPYTEVVADEASETPLNFDDLD